MRSLRRLTIIATAGCAVVVNCDCLTTAMSRVVEAQAIGRSQTELNPVQWPGPPPRGPRP